jgi:hypothetical protein
MSTWDEITLPQNFNKLVIILLNGIQLIIRNQPHRICEIELYYYTSDHQDEYVHQHDIQLTFGRLYFHQFKNNSFRGGNYKGMDITFGRPNMKFGILLRSIQTPTGEIISGPCLVVNYLLQVWGCNSIQNFVNTVGSLSVLTPNLFIYLQPLCECKNESILTGPRIGLSDKYPYFKNLNYRFVSQTAYKGIKKQKRQLIKFY